MKKHLPNQPKTMRLRQIAVAASTVVVLAAFSKSSLAQVGTIASFDVNISSSELVLAFPDDPMVMHFQSWDSPLNRIIERNMPFIEVTNSANSTVNMSQFRFTIGDTNYNFTDEVLGAFAVLGDTSPNGSITGSTGGDELIIDFGDGGLAPGETARFQVDINPDPGFTSFVHPDYRTVFFDIIGQSGQPDDDSDNSVATGVFDLPDDGTREVMRRLQDVAADGPVFVNGDIRPYSVMEMVEFEPAGETTPNPAVTDPDCIMLDQVDVMGMIADAIVLSNDGDVGTAIDVLSFEIVGDDAALFEVKDFEQVQLISGQDPVTFGLKFLGAGEGDYDAQIVFNTSAGDVTVDVCANVHAPIPEPAAAALLALGLVGLTASANRRRRR